jgi:hypothetical protein
MTLCNELIGQDRDAKSDFRVKNIQPVQNEKKYDIMEE